MKQELHQRLWAAQERWMEWKAKGETKRGLKLEGLRDHGDLFARTRYVIFTGSTRATYERELKRFINFVHDIRGKTENRLVDERDFKSFMETLLARGAAAKELNKVKSAIAKFGALYGKAESFASVSRKLGKRIRELIRKGKLAPPARPHITPEVRDEVIIKLEELDRASEQPRAYALVARLQKEASLRSIEATERLTRQSLEGNGALSILGKGGRVRKVEISQDLYKKIEEHFKRSLEESLAPRRGYQLALRRATLAVGGRSTGSHSHRRTSATEKKNELYRKYASEGHSPQEARELAVGDTVEHLGHSRFRKDTATAYLS
jgi:site-specific recombinase XerC